MWFLHRVRLTLAFPGLGTPSSTSTVPYKQCVTVLFVEGDYKRETGPIIHPTKSTSCVSCTACTADTAFCPPLPHCAACAACSTCAALYRLYCLHRPHMQACHTCAAISPMKRWPVRPSGSSSIAHCIRPCLSPRVRSTKKPGTLPAGRACGTGRQATENGAARAVDQDARQVACRTSMHEEDAGGHEAAACAAKPICLQRVWATISGE
eukprot:351840-Chlamydomonas_euryale.AAC.3